MKIAYTIVIVGLMSFTCAYTMDDDTPLTTDMAGLEISPAAKVDGWKALDKAQKKKMYDTVDNMAEKYQKMPMPDLNEDELDAVVIRTWRDIRHAMRKGASLPATEEEYNAYFKPNIQWARDHTWCTIKDVSDVSADSSSDGESDEEKCERPVLFK